jgi:DNA invertase Pin-like site-specific DNA recombinase
MRAALYARVSTSAGQHPEMQIAELRAYCQRRDWIVSGEFVDAGVSGARERRPELDRMMLVARRREFDAVVVFRYDRFARSLRQLVNALAEFDALGIAFVSLHEGVDTGTPNGRLVFGIFASIAEFERELIRERILAGLAHARSKGVRVGRPPRRVDAELARMFAAEGRGQREIARLLHISRGTLRRALAAGRPGGWANGYDSSGIGGVGQKPPAQIAAETAETPAFPAPDSGGQKY